MPAELEIERDPKFPVRVNVQLYRETRNCEVSADDLADISKQIKRVYCHADCVGSLVTEDDTGRPTEYDGNNIQPPDWWDRFRERCQKNTGQDRKDAIRMLPRLYGPNWMPGTRGELLKAVAAAEKKTGK